MENQYFSENDTLWSITERYPETVDIFVSRGFAQMRDRAMRKAFGTAISLKVALTMKKLNIEGFSDLLTERIRQVRDGSETVAGDVLVQGLLPCPVRIPLVEQLDAFLGKDGGGNGGVRHDLKAASVGVDWLKELLEGGEDVGALADIFISAGFDLFFEQRLMGRFKEREIFVDALGFDRLNADFDNDRIQLRDPAGHYSMLGVVPAVFLVNREELGDRPVPRRWSDILRPEYEGSISLPIGDFDLFNAILLHLHKEYGESAVEKLGRSLLRGMHPSEMVKSHRKKTDRPAVTIMPYFFTKMIREGGTMEAVWPEDGAIISPIFMLCKREKIERLQPLVDFFGSREVGETLSHKGLFPSINPDVDNRLPEGSTFMWLGWDYIYSHDIGELIRRCTEIFDAAVRTGGGKEGQ